MIRVQSRFSKTALAQWFPAAGFWIIEGVIHSGNEPDINKIFDLTMMALSGGRQRTRIEYQKLMEAAGFTLSQIISTESVMGVSVIEGRRAQTLDVAPNIG